MLRLLAQCERIGVLNQLFSACNNPQKQISSSIYFDEFKKQLTKYHQKVALDGSPVDKEQVIKLLKAIKKQHGKLC